MHSLWFGLDLKRASDTARLHHQLVPNVLDYENWLEPVSDDAEQNITL